MLPLEHTLDGSGIEIGFPVAMRIRHDIQSLAQRLALAQCRRHSYSEALPVRYRLDQTVQEMSVPDAAGFTGSAVVSAPAAGGTILFFTFRQIQGCEALLAAVKRAGLGKVLAYVPGILSPRGSRGTACTS